MALVGVRRSWLAVGAVLGLVGSLLAVGVVPAAAVDGKADNEAVYSACVGPALESLGLVDVVGSFAEDAVNCLGHYGITKGRTATTYDPGAPVLRWQMALFLTRAASPAGVQLLADPADDFTDLEGVSDEIRSAINQMVGLGIMSGRSGGRFSPDTAVSRAEMASMLDAFLVKARPGKGAFGGEAGVDELGDVTPDATGFTDIGSVTRGQYSAIERMFELGVTRGTSDDRFSPGGLVTRAQMAAFITRMLAHTVARPAGLTMQASALSVAGTADSLGDVDLVVSLRDSIHMAVADESVDVFSAANAGDAFGSDGRCSVDEVLRLGDGTGVCEIEVSDGQTDSDGDVEITGQFGASATVWAWAGDVGDRFDVADTVWASLEITVTKPATKLRITDDMAVNATAAQFGDRVTFVVQVVDDDGNPVATKDVSVTVAANTTVASNADGVGPQTSGATNTRKTDDSGRIELSYRQTDPRTSGSDHGGDRAWLDLDISFPAGYSGDLMLEDKTTLKKAVEADGAMVGDAAVVWRDGTPVATTLTLAQAVEYHESSGTGSGASNTVTATLVDQYGDPVSRQRVEFTSDDADGIGAKPDPDTAGAPAVLVRNVNTATSEGTRVFKDADALLTRTTNRRGVASLTYNRDSADSRIETILAEVTVGSGSSARTIPADRIYHYWANEPSDGDRIEGRLMVTNTDDNQLVIAGVGVSLIKYDSNDHLTTPDGAVTLSGFETDLKDNAKHVTVSRYQDTSKDVSQIATGGAWATLDHPGGQAALNADPRFGQSVAADNGVIVVGAGRENVDHDDDPMTPKHATAGRVYVYESFDDTKPTILQLHEDFSAANAKFGYDVDVSVTGSGATRLTTIVVGAPGIWGNAGRAFVFTHTGPWGDNNTIKTDDDNSTKDTAWMNQTGDPGLASMEFGAHVAVSGDGKTVAVAAPYTVDASKGKAMVVMYQRGSDGWSNDGGHTDNGILQSSYSSPYFNRGGRGLAISEDGSVVAVGVGWATNPLWSTVEQYAGKVAVFVKGAGVSWYGDAREDPNALLSPAEGSTFQGVAKYVGMSDDGNTIVASGHFQHNHAEGRTGAAYVFTKPNTSDGWGATPSATVSVTELKNPAVLSAAGVQPSDVLGQYVAIKSDGSEVAASRHHRQEGDSRGSVLTYTKPKEGGWASTTSPDSEYLGVNPGDGLGWATTYDRADGTLYSSLARNRSNPIDGGYYKQLTIFRIDR